MTIRNVYNANAYEWLEQLITEHQQVKFSFTNYTAQIEIENQRIVFHPDNKIKKPFGVFQKIKKDIDASGVESPDIDRSQVKYYAFKNTNYPEKFYSVDISSAYATVLKNYELIKPETYNYLLYKIQKEDRLKSVGMLGTTKNTLMFCDGEIVDHNVKVSKYAHWFTFCCYITGEVMELAKQRSGENFLFYWVDGIAVKEGQQEILEYLNELGYPSKIDVIENCRKEGNTLFYSKNGHDKILQIPKKQTIENEQIKQYLEQSNLR